MRAFFGICFLVVEHTSVYLLVLVRTEHTDLIVAASKATPTVVHRVDMELRRAWLAGQFTKALGKLFLQLVVEVILSAKEDYSSLRD